MLVCNAYCSEYMFHSHGKHIETQSQTVLWIFDVFIHCAALHNYANKRPNQEIELQSEKNYYKFLSYLLQTSYLCKVNG